jgi:hypothetical protein
MTATVCFVGLCQHLRVPGSISKLVDIRHGIERGIQSQQRWACYCACRMLGLRTHIRRNRGALRLKSLVVTTVASQVLTKTIAGVDCIL